MTQPTESNEYRLIIEARPGARPRVRWVKDAALAGRITIRAAGLEATVVCGPDGHLAASGAAVVLWRGLRWLHRVPVVSRLALWWALRGRR